MRCTGHCCRSFRVGGGALTRAPIVAAMVVPLGEYPEGATLPDGSVSKGGAYYDCRHLAPSGNCQIYARRPRMCRDYPNGEPCQKPGCTYMAA